MPCEGEVGSTSWYEGGHFGRFGVDNGFVQDEGHTSRASWAGKVSQVKEVELF